MMETTKSQTKTASANKTAKNKVREKASAPRTSRSPHKPSRSHGADKSRSTRSITPLTTKRDQILNMLHRTSGASIDEIVAEVGWQHHSVRGFLSAVVRKKLALPLESSVKKDGLRRYRIVAEEA
jgi:hypothetical protein